MKFVNNGWSDIKQRAYGDKGYGWNEIRETREPEGEKKFPTLSITETTLPALRFQLTADVLIHPSKVAGTTSLSLELYVLRFFITEVSERLLSRDQFHGPHVFPTSIFGFLSSDPPKTIGFG